MPAPDRITELAASVLTAQAGRRDMDAAEAVAFFKALRAAMTEAPAGTQAPEVPREEPHRNIPPPVVAPPPVPGQTDLGETLDAALEAVEGEPSEDVPPPSAEPPPAIVSEPQESRPTLVPAVPIADAKTDKFIACLHCGKRMDNLKRHLWQSHPEHGYRKPPQKVRDPETGRSRMEEGIDNIEPLYQANWGLPPGYSLSAGWYERMKSDIAKQQGLGKIGRRLRSTPAQSATMGEPASDDAVSDDAGARAEGGKGKAPRAPSKTARIKVPKTEPTPKPARSRRRKAAAA